MENSGRLSETPARSHRFTDANLEAVHVQIAVSKVFVLQHRMFLDNFRDISRIFGIASVLPCFILCICIYVQILIPRIFPHNFLGQFDNRLIGLECHRSIVEFLSVRYFVFVNARLKMM